MAQISVFVNSQGSLTSLLVVFLLCLDWLRPRTMPVDERFHGGLVNWSSQQFSVYLEVIVVATVENCLSLLDEVL